MNKQSLPSSIGAALGGGYYGGIVRIHDQAAAVVWAPKALGEHEGVWSKPRKTADIAGARSCFDSMANTLAMAEAGSELAQWALRLEISGLKDWCLPARDVLELAYRHLKPTTDQTARWFRDGDNPSSIPAGYPYAVQTPAQTEVEAFRAGSPEAFEPAWYWSSTQSSAHYAWGQDFGNGDQGNGGKSVSGRVRAVRLIPLID